MKSFLNGQVLLHHGDNREVLRGLADNSVDSFVTDPPYALVSIVNRFGGAGAAECKVPEGGSGAYARASKGFMGKTWDTGDTVHAVEFWQEVLRVLKPGGHVVAFNGTRTQHRMVCAIEDAGFEIRDMLAWLYGTGFPKSHDVGKGIDKAAGAVRETTKAGVVKRDGYGDDWDTGPSTDRPRHDVPATLAAQEWQGWGTALKPALEPICLARKPLIGTVAANVLAWGTGALNIDGTRVGTADTRGAGYKMTSKGHTGGGYATGQMDYTRVKEITVGSACGRWPANVVHDGSEEVVDLFPNTKSGTGAIKKASAKGGADSNSIGKESRPEGTEMLSYGDEGSASRFFYSAKANKKDRADSKHPTVKPVSLMQWLCRLVTPPGGTLVDPFAGSGTTGEAAYLEGFRAILIEREEEYVADITRRLESIVPANDNISATASAVA